MRSGWDPSLSCHQVTELFTETDDDNNDDDDDDNDNNDEEC